MIKKIILPVILIVIFILLVKVSFFINQQTCIFDNYDYVDNENPLKNKLGQEITLKGLPHRFKGDYWLESNDKDVCLIWDFFNLVFNQKYFKKFQNYAKENDRSIQLKGTVEKDIRCYLPCPENNKSQVKCSEVKQKELHYCVRVKEISE